MALNDGTPEQMSSSFNLHVTNIDAVGPFLRVTGQINKSCVAILEQHLAAIDAELRAGKGKLPQGIVTSPGTLCLALSKDNAFYRACVLDVRGEYAYVSLIDYGNREMVSFGDIRALDHFSQDIVKIPPLATQYILAGGASIQGSWDDSSLSLLQQSLCGREFPCIVVANLPRWTLVSIPFNASRLIDYLISSKLCVPISVIDQAKILDHPAEYPVYPPTMRSSQPPDAYADHAVPYPRGFPSNPAAAMRRQSYSPQNGNYAPPPDPQHVPAAPSAISQRLQAHRTAPRNPINLRSLQKATHANGEPASPSAPSPQPASPRKMTTYKSRLLEVNTEHKVCVSFARDGPELFAVQLASDAIHLKEMMNEINKLPHSSLREPPMIGTVCLGRMSGERTICRAIVMNICGSQCKLFFVDFGDTELVSYYDIFDIPDQFVKPNVYALRFCLSGLSELTKGPDLNQAFQQMVELKKVTLRVVSPEGPPLIQYGELYIDGKSVLELLKESSNETLVLKTLGMLPAGTTISALVSYVDSCHKFFIQLSDNMDTLNEVMNDVDLHCKSSQPLVSVREGAPCCARFPDDGVWYRAQVVEARGERALVCYIDYGNEQEVDLSELRPITAKLLELPAQAIKCALKGFEDRPIDQLQSNQLEMLALERTLRASVAGHFNGDSMLVTLVHHDGASPPIDIARKMSQLSRPPGPRDKQPREPVPEPRPEPRPEPQESPESDAGERNRFRSDRYFREDRRRDDEPRGGSFRQDRSSGKPWEKNQDKGDDRSDSGAGQKGFRDRDNFASKDEPWSDSHDRRDNRDRGDRRERGEKSFGDRPPRRENKDWERKDSYGEKRDNWGDKKDSYGEKRDNWGDKKDNWADKKDNWGDKKDNWGDKKESYPKRNFQDRGDRAEEKREDRSFEKRERSNFTPRDRTERSFDGNRSFGSKNVPKELSNPVPLETLFKNPEIEIGSQVEVSIAWFTSPENFFAQITSQQATFTDMMNRIPQMYKGVRPYSGNIDVGSSVLARFPEDRVLYRATVMGVQPYGKYIVQYIDFGNKTLVESRDIWQLEQELIDLPKMAIQCSLSGVKPLEKEWGKSKEMDLCFNDPRYQCVFTDLVDGIYRVSLWNNGVSVAEMLAEKGLAALDMQSSVTPKDEPIDLSIVVGQEILCRVTHVESVRRFHVQLDLEKARAVEALVDSLDRTALVPLADETVVDGTHCMLAHGDKLSRAILEDASDRQGVKAQLPDYGYSVTVPAANLYNLHPELSTYYYQSLVCRFNNYDESCTRLLDDEQLVAKLKDHKFIMYINHVEESTIVSTLYEPAGDKLCLFEPDEGAYPGVVPLSARAVFNYNFGPSYLSHAAALDSVYLQRASDEPRVSQLLEDLFKFYEEGTPECLDKFEEGGLCAAKSSDGNWYRATITSFTDETISVQFVDYGNSEDLPKESIKKLDPKFYEPCCLAIVVSLGLTPVREDAVAKLSEMLSEKEVLVTLTIGDEGWLANLHLNGEDISLKLVNENIAAPQVAAAEAVTEKKTAPAETVQVYIAHIDTPGQFWLQMADKVDKIEEIQAELQENSTSYPELETKDMGTLCVAKYSVDDMWYRAEILDSDSDITTVRFIDYGNTDVLDNVPGLFKEMPEHLKSIEKFAVKSSANAVPTGTGQWSEPASDYFTELVGDISAPLDALIVLKDVTTYVDLFVNGENLTDKLVMEKHATRSEKAECGDLASCFASHVNSPSEFWIQLESSTPDLQAMEAAMADCENFPELTSKEEGTLCAAKYPEDGCWYRAQIIVEGSEGIEVLFMDYGNASIATELRSLPEELKLKPALSRKCALQKPRDIKSWSRKSEQKFNEMAAEGATIFTVQFIASGDISIVELYLDGKSVTEELAAISEETPINERPTPVGQELLSNGTVTQINSLSDFYFKVDNPSDTMAEKLEAAETFEEAGEVKVGSVVAAKWEEDELWYRAKIIELCDVGAHVLFLDYGNKSKCDLFRQLPEDIASVEPLAQHCALVSYQHKDIDEKCTQAFQTLIEDPNAVFQIEFLDTTKEPRVVRLLLNGQDVSGLLKAESKTIDDVKVEESLPETATELVVESATPEQSGSPVKSSPLKSESPIKSATPPQSPVKSATPVQSGSPVKTPTPLQLDSPVKSTTPSQCESPVKSCTPAQSESPVKSTTPQSGSPVKSSTPAQSESPVKSTTPQSGSPVKSTTPQSESPVKSATPQSSPAKSTTPQSGSPVKSSTPAQSESPVKYSTPAQSESPVKSTTPQSGSPVKSTTPQSGSPVKSEPGTPGQAAENADLEVSALDESAEANVTVIEHKDEISTEKCENEVEEFITPKSTPGENSVKSESLAGSDAPENLNESVESTNSKSDAEEMTKPDQVTEDTLKEEENEQTEAQKEKKGE